MVSYAGNITSNKSIFECAKCKFNWNAKFDSVCNDGSGCPKCAGKLKVTLEEVLRRLIGRKITLLHYSGNVTSKSKFKCDVCELTWDATFDRISRGSKCPRCCGKLKVDQNSAIDRLKSKNITLIKYSGCASTKSLVECNICNHTWKSSINCIYFSKGGCAKCAGNLKLTEEQWRERLEGRSLTMIKYSGKSYIKSTFECSDCFYLWNSLCSDIANGRGCPKCTKRGFNPTKPAWIYRLLISSPQGYCYGFGITNNLIKRMRVHRKNLKDKLVEEYEPIYFTNGLDARELESKWKKCKYKVNIGVQGFITEALFVNKDTTKIMFQ